MYFKERDFVIANILIKTPTNIIGGGTIMGVKIEENKVYDLISQTTYPIVDTPLKLKNGVGIQILNTPFKDSDKIVSTSIFKKAEFKEYIKKKEQEQQIINYLNSNPEYINKKNIHCSEDSYLYTEAKKSKIKRLKKD